MPILPGYEPRQGTIQAKTLYEISLEYQLSKLIYFRDRFVTMLNRPRNTHYVEDDCRYYHDIIINNAATLAEYYLPYVIYSIIGTILPKPLAPRFDGFRKNIDRSGYDVAKLEIFKRYKIGILSKNRECYREGYKEEYLSNCHNTFDNSMKFLIDGSYDIIFALNNYIKHNSMNFDYAPLLRTSSGEVKNYLFLRFTADQQFMLGESILKNLISYSYNDIINNDNQKFILNGAEFTRIGNLGHIILLKNNNILYTKGNSSAGVTSESLLALINELMIRILENMILNVKDYEITQFEKYNKLLAAIKRMSK
ncbi:hypothetical protein F164LOC_18825 [Pectobacterium carotovorum]|nr:hypothetical protein F164LOC_18825 [Pectobacterium carotovorum]